MTKTEMCRKITGLGEQGMRTLVYYLTDENEGEAKYGVAIECTESGSVTVASRLTNDKERAERLLDLLATYFITPLTLNDVAYKWLAAL